LKFTKRITQTDVIQNRKNSIIAHKTLNIIIINKFFHKAHRRGLVTTVYDIQSLIDKHDTHLFRSIAYTDHCLHYLLPEILNRSINLRHRGHD